MTGFVHIYIWQIIFGNKKTTQVQGNEALEQYSCKRGWNKK